MSQVFPSGKAVFSAIGILLSVRIPSSLSHALSHLGLLDGQICEGELRRPSRYLRMHRELSQKTQDIYRYSAYSRDDWGCGQDIGRTTLGARASD